MSKRECSVTRNRERMKRLFLVFCRGYCTKCSIVICYCTEVLQYGTVQYCTVTYSDRVHAPIRTDQDSFRPTARKSQHLESSFPQSGSILGPHRVGVRRYSACHDHRLIRNHLASERDFTKGLVEHECARPESQDAGDAQTRIAGEMMVQEA